MLWLRDPINIISFLFRGRKWVEKVLNKIANGSFCLKLPLSSIKTGHNSLVNDAESCDQNKCASSSRQGVKSRKKSRLKFIIARSCAPTRIFRHRLLFSINTISYLITQADEARAEPCPQRDKRFMYANTTRKIRITANRNLTKIAASGRLRGTNKSARSICLRNFYVGWQNLLV